MPIRHRIVFLMIVAIVMSLALVGCNSAPPDDSHLIQSEKSRDTAPNVPAADLSDLVTGNSAFAADMFQALRQAAPNGNVVFSPYSISVALAMTYAGARTQTAEEIADALHFTLPAERFHPAFDALDLALSSRGQNALGMDGKPFRLNIANSLWGQEGFPFLTEFLDNLSTNYGSGMRAVDFAADPENARMTVNQWVSDRTEAKIPELLAKGIVDTSTRLVLVNAIYMNAAWKSTFEKSQTHDGPFNLLDGTPTTVSMMHQTHDFKYSEGDGFQAVELPYDGEELSMVILLPQSGKFTQFETALTIGQITSIIGNLHSEKIALTMPKFKATARFDLKEVLTSMGMPLAFDPNQADFSGMDGQKDLYIAFVVHQAYVLVNEAGTEAAAATGVGMSLTAAPIDQPREVKIDRPFLFLIRDIQTGSILFVGRILNPAL